jgi:hypothetical protein
MLSDAFTEFKSFLSREVTFEGEAVKQNLPQP